MTKKLFVILGVVIAVAAVSDFSNGQSSPARRSPSLSTDDLGPSRARVVEESASQPSLETARGPMLWHRDFKEAAALAREQGKLIVADVYTDWCGWCKKMDVTIYRDPAVVAMSHQQIFIKVNAEDGGQGQNFARQMRVKGYPTTIILDANGRVLNVSEGYISSAKAFNQLIQEARSLVQ
jgi:thiol:disulfide interchange protein